MYSFKVWFEMGSVWVLWHIDYSKIFNTKPCLYMYIKYLVWLSFMAYQLFIDFFFFLMPNPFYGYILNI